MSARRMRGELEETDKERRLERIWHIKKEMGMEERRGS